MNLESSHSRFHVWLCDCAALWDQKWRAWSPKMLSLASSTRCIWSLVSASLEFHTGTQEFPWTLECTVVSVWLKEASFDTSICRAARERLTAWCLHACSPSDSIESARTGSWQTLLNAASSSMETLAILAERLQQNIQKIPKFCV